MSRCCSLVLVVLCGVSAAVSANNEGRSKLPERHHPVDVVVPDSMQIPDAWSLSDDKEVICSTCHGIEDIDHEENWENIDKKSADFLHDGPYRTDEDFCFQCHDERGYGQWNIHKQYLDDETLDENSCTYCHMEQPKQFEGGETDKTDLRLEHAVLCLGCHLKTPHLNSLEHAGVPSELVMEVLDRHNKERERPLPLDDQKRVTCVTCHDPHQPGVIEHLSKDKNIWLGEADVEKGPVYVDSRWSTVYQADKQERLMNLQKKAKWPIKLRYKRLEQEVLLRLPAKDGTLCNACHQFED